MPAGATHPDGPDGASPPLSPSDDAIESSLTLIRRSGRGTKKSATTVSSMDLGGQGDTSPSSSLHLLQDPSARSPSAASSVPCLSGNAHQYDVSNIDEESSPRMNCKSYMDRTYRKQRTKEQRVKEQRLQREKENGEKVWKEFKRNSDDNNIWDNITSVSVPSSKVALKEQARKRSGEKPLAVQRSAFSESDSDSDSDDNDCENEVPEAVISPPPPSKLSRSNNIGIGLSARTFYGGKTSTPTPLFPEKTVRRPPTFWNRPSSVLKGMENHPGAKRNLILPFTNSTARELGKEMVEASPEKVGFRNTGNTCYINSVFQCLLGAAMFLENLERLLEKTEETKLRKFGLSRMFADIATNRKLGKDLVGPMNAFKMAFDKHFPMFKGEHQQDAHEFLVQFFTRLIDEADFIIKKYPEVACPVKSNFEFCLIETKKCQKCGKVSERMSRDTIFKVTAATWDRDVQEHRIPAITDLIQGTLHSQIEMICDVCEIEVDVEIDGNVVKKRMREKTLHSVTERFDQLPRLLIVFLPRISFAQESMAALKRKNAVKIQEVISVKDMSSQEGNNLFQSIGVLSLERLRRRRSRIPSRNKSPEWAKPDSARSISPPFFTLDKAQRRDESKKNDLAGTLELSHKDVTGMTEEEQLEMAVSLSLREQEQSKTWNEAGGKKYGDSACEPNRLYSNGFLAGYRNNVPSSPVSDEAAMEVSCEDPGFTSTPPSSPLDRSKRSFTIQQSLAPLKFNNLSKSQIEALSEEDAIAYATCMSLKESEEWDDLENVALATDVEQDQPIVSAGGDQDSQREGSLSEKMNSATQSGSPDPIIVDHDSSARRKDLLLPLPLENIFQEGSPENASALHEYRWTGVVSHLGNTTAVGHYVASVFSSCKGRWLRYSDSVVREHRVQSIARESATNGYLFFYTHLAYLSGDENDSSSPIKK